MTEAPSPIQTIAEAMAAPSATPAYQSLLSYFPGGTIRPAQSRALDAWSKVPEKGKDFAIFELPTGAGKSFIAWTAANAATENPDGGYRPGGYILTTQKTLQQQYMRDFEASGMADLRGSSNYHCHDFDTDCKTGALLRKALKAQGKEVVQCEDCEYRAAKNRFMDSPVGVTNFAYFLNEANLVKQLPPRQLLVIDEAHNTESQLLSQAEIEITMARCDTMGAPYPPKIENGAMLEARAWVLDEFLPAATLYIQTLRTSAYEAPTNKLRGDILNKVSALESFIRRINNIKDPESTRDWYCSSDDKGTLRLRPLTAYAIAHEQLFKHCRRTMFLSATILDPLAFARGLGLDPALGGVCKVGSDFPLENRPIHFYPSGSMSFKNKSASLPRMLKVIERVLARHQNDKGIIHAQSYALTKAIQESLTETVHASRLIVPESGFQSRLAALQRHADSPEPTVLLSPSMTEGLDLHGDLSRFQILPKVPFPSLADPFIRARKDRDPAWYTWQAALTVVQATGRSIRSREDFATTYILDSDFNMFMNNASGILPDWWTKSIIYH